MAGRGSPPLSGYAEGVRAIDIPNFPWEPNSIDAEFLDATMPPGEENLLHTSPLVPSGDQVAQPPENPLPGGVPRVPQPSHPDQQDLLRRLNPLQVLSPEDVLRIKAR